MNVYHGVAFTYLTHKNKYLCRAEVQGPKQLCIFFDSAEPEMLSMLLSDMEFQSELSNNKRDGVL